MWAALSESYSNLTLEIHLQRHATDDDRRNMYNMAPFEDLDDKHAEPPPKWATHFSSHLEKAVKNKEKLMKQKSTQSLDPNPTQPPTLYYRKGHSVGTWKRGFRPIPIVI